MSKRRTTRNSSKKSKALSVVNKENMEDEGNSAHRSIIDNIEFIEEQKQWIFKEFDSDVASALKDFNKKSVAAEGETNVHFQKVIAAIPSELRNMTLAEFAACGGSIEKILESGRLRDTANRKAQIQALIGKPADLEEETGDICELGTVQRGMKQKKSRRALKNENFTPNMMPSTSSYQGAPDSEREFGVITNLDTVQKTLKGSRCRQRLLQTPAITPKFDPQLPLTPANTREVKPGERMMSLAGTPLKKTIEKRQLEENLKECGAGLTPTRIEKIVESIESIINLID